MSPTPSRCAAPAAAAAAVLVLAACGGDDGAPASSGAAAGATGSGDDFCSRAAGMDERVDTALADLDGGVPSVPDALHQVAQELRDVDPPAAIAADWESVAGGLDRMADALSDTDLTDPASLEALEAAEEDLTAAGDRVDAYLRDECDIG